MTEKRQRSFDALRMAAMATFVQDDGVEQLLVHGVQPHHTSFASISKHPLQAE
jgi:hypothetical protein